MKPDFHDLYRELLKLFYNRLDSVERVDDLFGMNSIDSETYTTLLEKLENNTERAVIECILGRFNESTGD